MADFLTKKQRSTLMSCIRGKGNKDTELALMKLFRLHGISGWRRHAPLPGKPDFIFRQARVAIFVDGCFWHGCPQHCKAPSSNRAFWKSKLAANRARDRRVSRVLRKEGWRVLRIWEHDLKQSNRALRRVAAALCMKKPSLPLQNALRKN